MHAWEDELPSVDLITRETLRISGSSTAFRRNTGKDIQVGEATIKRGDFLVYSAGETNLNPDIYTNPTTFDPNRYGPGRQEDRKEAFGYLAWGAGRRYFITVLSAEILQCLTNIMSSGRHLCAGMKIAKLELKVVLAMILLGYEYELVDGNDKHLSALPEQDRNNFQKVRFSL